VALGNPACNPACQTRFLARPSRLKSRLAAKIGRPTSKLTHYPVLLHHVLLVAKTWALSPVLEDGDVFVIVLSRVTPASEQAARQYLVSTG